MVAGINKSITPKITSTGKTKRLSQNKNKPTSQSADLLKISNKSEIIKQVKFQLTNLPSPHSNETVKKALIRATITAQYGEKITLEPNFHDMYIHIEKSMKDSQVIDKLIAQVMNDLNIG
ncbi:MAG: hypothetical protein HRT37_07990 [Alteromonadaceae bacterium]|nr:hypothetical protein [Alteromonadaceae bacterium]